MRRHDGAVQDAGVVFDDCHLPDDDSLPDVHVASDAGGLDDGARADVDMVSHSQGQVCEGTAEEKG